MPEMNRRKLLATLAVAPLAAGVVARTAGLTVIGKERCLEDGRDPSREKTQEDAISQTSSLTTHEGKKVRFYDDLIKDKIVVINFMYAKCEGVCMPITMNLKRVQNLLAAAWEKISSCIPSRLNPKKIHLCALKQYVRAASNQTWLDIPDRQARGDR